MLDSLSTRLQSIFDRLGGHGRLTEENIQEALREVRVALLEADVNFKVVRTFIDRVRDKAVGQDVLRSLTPAQQVVKVVHDELVELLGGSGHRLAPAPHPPTVIMLIGLQGSGKTTTAAKLARWYTKQGQHPLLAAADTQRPAAQEQLRTLGAQLDVPVVAAAGQTPLEICRQAREEAATRGLTPLILDTAGRLHIDEAMLEELVVIRKQVGPHHVLLVVDAMTGQDAVTVADHFNKAVGIDAVILTKLGGDARGGGPLRALGDGPADRVRGDGREDRRARAIPPRPARLADPRHGRRALARRARPGDGGPGESRGARPEAPRGRVHTRRLPRAAPPGAPARAARPDPRHATLRQGAQGGAERPHRGVGRPRPLRRDPLVDDAGRAEEPGDHQRQPSPADRARQRHHRAGRQPAAQAVRAVAEDDEAVQGHGGEAAASHTEGVTTWQFRFDSDAPGRTSGRPIGWSSQSRARRATDGSSRSWDTTTR